ncbi:hypothetical protein AURDEDRAFT_123999 [Auricularia subglabra TFB-10046 SS5]|nr:hypothetical protein AURDEDRAFT_123999 [Auricularia subglabra TFB-10046 SS5]
MIYMFYGWFGIISSVLEFYLDSASIPEKLDVRNSSNRDGREPVLMGYNQLAFQSKKLLHDIHTLRVVTHNSDVCFDYAIYTADDDEPPETGQHTQSPHRHSESALPSGSSTGGNKPVARHGHQLFNRKAVEGATGAAASIALAIGAWVCVRRRRKTTRHSEQTVPFTAEPNPELTAPVEKDVKSRWDDAGRAAIVPFMTQADPAVQVPESKDDKTRWEQGPSAVATSSQPQFPLAESSETEETADIKAELARVRAENERARAENERARAENERARAEIEMLRQAVEPPPYSDGGRASQSAIERVAQWRDRRT